MDDTIATFGFNAGRLWDILNAEGSVDEECLVKDTQLSPEEVSSAIGWLARENKIFKNENGFHLGETNLTIKIGKDAGKVWKVLNIWDDVDLCFIAQRSRLTVEDVSAALGWLGRENKLQTTTANRENNQVLYRLSL